MSKTILIKYGEILLTSHNPQTIPNVSIAAIVPAYNEEKGIGNVLEVLSQVVFLSEIIVVDDGSTDGTGAIINDYTKKEPRIRFLRHEKNQGKGQSVYDAAMATSASIVLTVDADLIGLTPDHIYQLLVPLLDKKADMALGIFKGGNFRTDMSHWVTPWLTGQRAIWLTRLKQIYWPAAAGYGLETAITAASQKYHWKTDKVYWWGVSHPPSEEHRGLIKGVYNRSKMYGQILKAWMIATRGEKKAKKVKLFTY